LYALSFDYNQRHKRELESAQLIAEALRVKQHLIIRFDLRSIGGSALTSNSEVPKRITIDGSQATSGEKGSLPVSGHPSLIPVTYVPARNTIFLSFGLGWAEVLEAEDIFIGVNSIDYSGYPDCRLEYLWAFENMANLATKASLEGKLRFSIRAPLISMEKSEIIRKGVDLGLDYSLTWSCYDPQPAVTGVQSSKFKTQNCKENNFQSRTPDFKLISCGLCESCVIRSEGFRKTGLKDPLTNA
jgi:7-cyano-7-deazaguanine synthase